jgi:ComF family protein
MLKTKLKPVLNHLLDIIYPPRCISCGDNVHENGSICAKCWSDINFITNPQCNICGFPFDFEVSADALCSGCIKTKPSFSKARAVFIYDDASYNMIKSLKYHDKTENCAAYARWMSRVGSEMINDTDIIIPVPIHFSKLILRKYNQAALLAHGLAKTSNKKILSNAIIRKKNTKSQAEFSYKERFNNIKGAFKINSEYLDALKNKNRLLIDDVITTGATVEECTKMLLRAKVAKVEVLTLAKTLY